MGVTGGGRERFGGEEEEIARRMSQPLRGNNTVCYRCHGRGHTQHYCWVLAGNMAMTS